MRKGKSISICAMALISAVSMLSISTSAFAAKNSDDLLVKDEGYVIDGDGYYAKVAWCSEDDAEIFGRIYYPESFDENQKYTAVVICHGGKLTCDFQDKYFAAELARRGYICYVFDCRSATDAGRGSYSTPLDSGEADGVSYTKDFEAALAYTKTLPYVDEENIYLFGQSLGGIAAESTGSKHSDDIAGLIILYGCLSDNLSDRLADYEDVKANPYQNGEVLFIQGIADEFNSEADVIENMSWYEESSFMLLSNAPHGFGYMGDRPAEICVDTIEDFLQRTSVENR